MVEVVGGKFALTVHGVKEAQQLKRCCGLRVERGSRPPGCPEKLCSMFKAWCAAAEVERDVVETVDVKECEVMMSGKGEQTVTSGRMT